MSMFDADAFIEAHEAPQIKINNKVYQGRILSLPEYLPYYEKIVGFMELDQKEMTDEDKLSTVIEIEKIKRAFIREIFPSKLKYRLFLDPVDYIYNLPRAAQDEAFTSFFYLAGEAHGLIQKNRMNGTSSEKKA